MQNTLPTAQQKLKIDENGISIDRTVWANVKAKLYLYMEVEVKHR